MTSTHPELDLDIVNLVIDELHDSRPGLKTCALVCRSWVSQSRFHLFSTIRLNNRYDVSSFIALCASPYSTILSARTSNLAISTNRLGGVKYKDKSPGVFDQVLTWRSPHDGKSIADVFRHLKTLSLDGMGWRSAKSMSQLAFQTVTELRMRNVVFETGDDFLEFLSSLICLEKLCLINVSLRAPGQASTMQSNVFSSRFHTIDLKNLSPRSGHVIRAITPCHSLKNLSVHVHNFREISADCSMAIWELLVSAGPSLESFAFCVQAVGRKFKEDALDLDASLQHIDFTENSNLRKITLDVSDSAYLVPFLERLTKSRYPPSLEKLHIPWLVPEMGSTRVDYKRINELLQHPYFSALNEFRCSLYVVSERSETWYDGQPIEGSLLRKVMESKIEELKAAMSKLADKGILQVDKYFWQSRDVVHRRLWVMAFAFRRSFRKDKSDEDQDTENDDENRDDREREGGKD
ncbi:hypothetical protein K435DRAFT_968757 [Dendrothele bispora CBS 962.96]|uniref:F-box domain-containing protein n=1 Tax=Dendrothele bispora (strain CBS 962.96) TaxID=1314807 RepID=A0A4S8LM04_DENBC|nr:hypothetical protein K435DRAFT_968757 [Dendrothele bispora CBS 962.96]